MVESAGLATGFDIEEFDNPAAGDQAKFPFDDAVADSCSLSPSQIPDGGFVVKFIPGETFK